MSKVLYRPIGMAFSIAGGLVGGMVFKQVWKRVAGEDEAPEATSSEYSWGQVLLAAALQGAIFGLAKAAIDRAGAIGVRKLTGYWPGE
jgi:hypothetical protein